MKRLILIIFLVLSIGYISSAQNADDALRYSRLFYSGTARFMSMGGAFTALGGDISSLSQNPAGLGVFRSSEITITPQLEYFRSGSLFNGTSSNDYLYNFNLGQAGIVANLIKNDAESGLLTLNIGYSFNRTSNLTQTIVIDGISSNSSLSDYWVDEAKGKTKDQLSVLDNNVLDAYLAWSTYLIDSLAGYNDRYGTVYSYYGDSAMVYGQNMKRVVTNTGYTGEHAISIGVNYSNKLFLGATLGIINLSYERKYEHSESTDLSPTYGFTDFDYTLYYKDNGTGFNLKLGAIYKPIEILRIGFAFHSPTIYHVNRYVYDNISTHFNDGGHYTASNNPTRSSYGLTTPFRVMGGVALQVKKIALLSADYEFVDYGAAKFFTLGSDSYDYTNENQEIKNSLGTSSNIRLGAEVRLSNIYLRGGYGYYGKAWKAGQENENQAFNSLSFGLGFREQNLFADFGFSTTANKDKYILYTSSAGSAVSDLNMTRNMFTVTFGYKFGY
jgi:hypothetical protein